MPDDPPPQAARPTAAAAMAPASGQRQACVKTVLTVMGTCLLRCCWLSRGACRGKPLLAHLLAHCTRMLVAPGSASKIRLDGQGFHVCPRAAFCGLPVCRSEERRVGKECRSRWSPYH